MGIEIKITVSHRVPGNGLPCGLLRLVIAIALSLIFFSSLLTSAQNPKPPEGVAQAASIALKEFLPSLDSPKMKKTHGFAPDDDLSAVTLGEPFETRFLTAESAKKYTKGAKVEEFLTESRNWFFPVMSKGSQACLLSVMQKQDGTFMKDKLGMAQLACVWAAVMEAWPTEKGYTPLLVIVPSRQRFYFTVPQAQPPNLTRISIEQAESASPKLFKKLAPANEAFGELRD